MPYMRTACIVGGFIETSHVEPRRTPNLRAPCIVRGAAMLSDVVRERCEEGRGEKASWREGLARPCSPIQMKSTVPEAEQAAAAAPFQLVLGGGGNPDPPWSLAPRGPLFTRVLDVPLHSSAISPLRALSLLLRRHHLEIAEEEGG